MYVCISNHLNIKVYFVFIYLVLYTGSFLFTSIQNSYGLRCMIKIQKDNIDSIHVNKNHFLSTNLKKDMQAK